LRITETELPLKPVLVGHNVMLKLEKMISSNTLPSLRADETT